MNSSDEFVIKEVEKGWQVIHPLGYVCNDYTHKTYEEAEEYKRMLEAWKHVYNHK